MYIYRKKTTGNNGIYIYIYTRVKGSENFTPGPISLKISIVHFQYMGVEPNTGILPPKWKVRIMENPMNKWII